MIKLKNFTSISIPNFNGILLLKTFNLRLEEGEFISIWAQAEQENLRV